MKHVIAAVAAIFLLLAAPFAHANQTVASDIYISGSPVLSSAGTSITFSVAGFTGGSTLSPSSPQGFFVAVNGFNDPCSSALNTSSGAVTLTLATPVRSGAAVTLKYDTTVLYPATVSVIQDSSTPADTMGYVALFPVTNNSTVGTGLTLGLCSVSANGLSISVPITGATGTTTLGVAPAPYGFAVVVGSSPGAQDSVTSGSISGTSITLNLSSAIPSNASSVSVYYTNFGGASVYDSSSPVKTLPLQASATASLASDTVVASVFSDNFSTIVASASLTTSVPQAGTGWSTFSGTSMVGTNSAGVYWAHDSATSNNAIMEASPAPSTDNCCIETDAYIKSLNNSAANIYFKYNGSTGYYLSFSPYQHTISVNKVGTSFPSGTVSSITTLNSPPYSYTFTAGQTYSVGLAWQYGYIHDYRGGMTVGSYTVTNSGSGYTSAPTVAVYGGAAPDANATATESGGVVTGVNPTNYSTGFLYAPTVSFSGGGGSNAAATVNLIQGMPVEIITVYLASGSKQTLTTPVLTIVDTAPITQIGNVYINDTANTSNTSGMWFANFGYNYDVRGYSACQPQYQWQSSWSDGSYSSGYSTYNTTLAAMPAQDGVPPYSYSLYRNTSLSTSGATLVSSLGSMPTSLTVSDTPTYQNSPYFYYYTVTDATGTVYYPNMTVRSTAVVEPMFVQVRRAAPLNIYYIGDSISTSGAYTTASMQVLSHYGGLRTVDGQTDISNLNPPASPTWYYGSSGSGVPAWTPTSALLTTAETNINSSHISVVSICLGANDNRDANNSYESWTPVSTYTSGLTSICSNIFTNCPSVTKIVIQYPTWQATNSAAGAIVWMQDSQSRVLDYITAIKGIANGTTIFGGDSTIYDSLATNPAFLADGVHPQPNFLINGSAWNGMQLMGFGWGDAIAQAIYGTTTSSVSTGSRKVMN